MAQVASEQSPAPILVQTEGGAVTLLTLEDLRRRRDQFRAQAATLGQQAGQARQEAEAKLAEAGAILVPRRSEWQVPGQLAPILDQANALVSRVAGDDREAASIKAESAGLIHKISAWHHGHEVGQDRAQAAGQLRSLLVQIGRGAPANALAEMEPLRQTATDLEGQASQLGQQAQQATSAASACDEELGRREAAQKALGFDSLYTAAYLKQYGAPEVDSPLVLKRGERALASVPATLARQQTRTRWVGGSQGFSFPIGHTGIRYRVGSYRGHPVQSQVLTRLDSGSLVVTNQRVAFVGQTKATGVPLAKLMHVEIYKDGLAIFAEGKENPDFYYLSQPNYVNFFMNWALEHAG